MIVIRFHDKPTERRALGYLAGRFSFSTWQTGEVLVPEAALADLAVEGLRFIPDSEYSGSATFTIESDDQGGTGDAAQTDSVPDGIVSLWLEDCG